MVQLFFIKDVQTGLVWVVKILTDPFHDIKLYYKAPLYLLRGELIDPGIGTHWAAENAEAAPRALTERGQPSVGGDRAARTAYARSSPSGSGA